MTIEEVRKLLGEKAESMSDEEVWKLEDLIRSFASAVVDKIWSMTPEQLKILDEKMVKGK